MGILDGILSQAGNNLNLEDLASRVGLSTDQLQMGADSILGQLAGDGTNDPQEAAAEAASQTGLPLDRLEQLLPQLTAQLGIGDAAGEGGALDGLLEQAKSFLDQDGDGNPLDDVADMARGLFNRS
ncbi:MAG: hypothetical protein AAGE05_11655 [Pseudomonadota bacterium]